jgi:hypothetical protein
LRREQGKLSDAIKRQKISFSLTLLL